MQGVAGERTLACFDFREPIQIGAQPAPAHGAFFGDAILALDEHIGFTGLREQFDAHARARLLPLARGQVGFERGEFAFGCSWPSARSRDCGARRLNGWTGGRFI